MKKRVALVGASMRARVFVNYLKTVTERWEIVGIMDIDPGKMQGFALHNQISCPHFTDFDEMCNQVHPDLVVITTVDVTHCDYVVRALNREIGVVSEKPLCINPDQCRQIYQAHLRHPDVFAVTSHNARYEPQRRKIKELLDQGVIGKVRSINYAEMLDLTHGTSYFRRWNGSKKNSGGLQLHKSTHHFDEMQFMLNSRADTVWATGAQIAYGPKASTRRGGHCHSCTLDCPYRVKYDQEQGEVNTLFFRYHTPGAYTPDRCIFGEDIDIEDYLSVGITYLNGAQANYNLIAHSSFEGQSISYQGEWGRLDCQTRLYRNQQNSGDLHDASVSHETTLQLCRYGHGEPENIALDLKAGTHGGADQLLFADIFADTPPATLPTLEDGIQAVLVGSAVNLALEQKKPIKVQALAPENCP